jgi:hypothetical protein
MQQQQQQQPVTTTRITSSRQAADFIGSICSFRSKGVREYGRIISVTPTSIRIERMQESADGDGDFIVHPNQHHSVTKNVITFTRNITIVAPAKPLLPALIGGIKRRYHNAQSVEQSQFRWFW